MIGLAWYDNRVMQAMAKYPTPGLVLELYPVIVGYMQYSIA